MNFENRFSAFKRIVILMFVGFISFGITFILMATLFSNEGVSGFLNKYQKFFIDDPVGVLANNILFFIFVFFPANYIIYVTFLEILIKYFGKKQLPDINDYHKPVNIKQLLGIFTILIVMFGFLPFFITIFSMESKVEKSVNTFFLLYTSAAMCPYFYLVRVDSNTSDVPVLEKQLSKILIKINEKFFILIFSEIRNAKIQILRLITRELYALSFSIVMIFTLMSIIIIFLFVVFI